MDIKPIPFSDGFFASSNGKIFDPQMNERIQYENGCKYKTASIRLKSGKWVTFGVHRLVALAHIPIDNHENFTVNHRDLIKANNDVSNLEWLTVYQNNLHAAIFRENPKRPIAYTIDSAGKYEFVSSIIALAFKTNASKLEIWDAVKNKTVLNGYEIFPFTDKTPVPEALKVDRRIISIKRRPIKILDIENDVVCYFESLHEAARVYSTTAEHVCMSICTPNNFHLFKRRYIIVEENENFPDYTKEQIGSNLGSLGFSVLAFNVVCERYEIYGSAYSFIRKNNLSKKAVTSRLKNEKIEKVGDYYFTYLNEKNRKRLFELVGCPEPNS